MKKIQLTILVIILSLSNLIGQTKEEYQIKFENGKNWLQSKNYIMAMSEFLPLTSRNEENPFDTYASYYYSIAALKVKKWQEATIMLEQLTNRYPDWEKDNIAYLFANVEFEKNNYEKAIDYLTKIKSSSVKKESDEMKMVYLTKVTSIDTLKKLYTGFPEDREIGKLLAEKIKATGNPNDQEMLSYLVKEFKLDEKEFLEKVEIIKKEKYNIGLLFPFSIQELDPEKTNRSNYYAIDMYEGIKLGIQKLAKKGIQIQLYCYDIGKDNKNIESVLKKQEIKAMDLLIGPFTNNPIPLLSEFAIQYKIPLLNPISFNSKLLENNFQLLLQPSYEMQAKKTAQFICNEYHPKKTVIFYGTSTKDILLAKSYRAQVQQDSCSLFAYQEIAEDNIEDIRCIVADTLNKDIDHIFVSISDQLIAANFVSEVAKSGFRIPIVVAHAAWINFPIFNYEQFETLNMHFINPDFIDYKKSAIPKFRNEYVAEVNIIPSLYGYAGHDLIIYFGNALFNYGINFTHFIEQNNYTSGELLNGYNYFQTHENQVIPIIKFKEGQPKIINSPH